MRKTLAFVLGVLLAGATFAHAAGLLTKAQAEKDALNAVGGGTVVQALLETELGKKIWSVDIAQTQAEYEVWVNAYTGAILKIITQPANLAAETGSTGLLSKAQAEQDALNAVGGGTVTQALLERELGKTIWSVDVTQPLAEYEVWVDAHTGAILKIIQQAGGTLSQATGYISKATAEKDALAAVGGGTVVQAVLETNDNPPVWSVDIVQPKAEYEVKVNAFNGKIVAIIPGG